MKKVLIILGLLMSLGATAQEKECKKIIPVYAKFSVDTVYQLIKEASKELVIVPAEYGVKKERIKVKDGFWDLQKINGEWCKVWVNPEYKMVDKTYTLKWATVKEIVIPAEYKAIVVYNKIKDGDLRVVDGECH